MRKTRNTVAAMAAAGVLACAVTAASAGPAAAIGPGHNAPVRSAAATKAAKGPGGTVPLAGVHSTLLGRTVSHHGGHHQVAPPHGSRHGHHERGHGGDGHHRHGGSLLGSSTGVHLYNNSVDKLVLTAVSGSNEGVPPTGSVLSSGVGYQDFEVTFRATKSTTVTASYDVYSPTGTKIGTATIQLSNDEWGSTSVTGTFTATDGSALPLMTAKDGNDFQVQGNSSAPITIDASSPTAVTLVNNYCNTTNTSATCTYTPSSRKAGVQMHLLAEGYTIPGGGNTAGTVSVSSGYSSSTSTSWSVTVTAQMELADVFSAGISSTYGQSVTWQNTFTAGDSIPVSAGYTGYIWGNVPVTNYSGTMQIKLGNTTYLLTNAGLSTPDPTRTLSDFYAGTWLGDDPLNSPDQPPANTPSLS